MTSPPKANVSQEEEDLSANVEGVDERAISRLEFVSVQLSKRRDRSCYKDIGEVNGCGGVSFDEQYNAVTTKSFLAEGGIDTKKIGFIRNQKRLIDISSVEVLTSTQYATKKRKARPTSRLLETCIGHDYRTLADACRPSYFPSIKSSTSPQIKLQINTPTRFTPFVPCLPLSMISLSQALAFYPKPRLIIEAAMPLLVVHANSAYFRLSGLSIEAVVGSPLSNLITISRNNNNILKCVQQTEVGQHVPVDIATQSTDISSRNRVKGKIRCQLYAFPVVADVNCAYVKNYFSTPSSPSSSGLRDVTHFLIELNYHDATLDVLDELMDNSSVVQVENAVTLMG